MKEQEIVVSLERARTLQSQGYPQRGSCFIWHEDTAMNSPWRIGLASKIYLLERKHFAAPTAEEICEHLPQLIDVKGSQYHLGVSHQRYKWLAAYGVQDEKSEEKLHLVMEDSMVEAVANLYLALVSGGVIKRH